MPQEFPSELERRLATLEDPANQGADFDAVSWGWLVGLGIVLPVLLLIWGR